MSQPPPADLKEWSKNDLIREVKRLRAITREHAESVGTDPREGSSPGSIIDVAGDPYAEGGVILDARSAVLLDEMDVSLVDTEPDSPVLMVASLKGRVNYATDRVEHAYLLGPDGAAAVVSEVLGLATRAADSELGHAREFADAFIEILKDRLENLP